VRLQGLAAELDTLRRYHREVLDELPLGVCSLTPEGDIVIWNSAMSRISDIPGARAVGQRVEALDVPWSEILGAFIAGVDNHLYKQPCTVHGANRWINLHKAAIDAGEFGSAAETDGIVVLVEDQT